MSSELSDDTIRITVMGKSQPAGSKQAFVPLDKDGNPYRDKSNGRIIVNVVDANPKSKEWKQIVGYTAKRDYRGPLLQGPISLVLRFYCLRCKGHFGTGRNAGIVKDSAPPFPIVKPDVLKLARAVEDALTGVLYEDDAQIVREVLTKEYGDTARVEIEVRPYVEPRDDLSPSEIHAMFGDFP